ncbi:hypothetical protein L1987_81509 [Smallanthus sonchifolius]|uniref:Uncharacterized protein n=1 Tax=Smallanthus sonchifolius TaxID=185202 RepID=A0ACB8YRS6_9ASTR|nr:hypothetical protein L1987_81509 [Smallanthus sonchifolius]
MGWKMTAIFSIGNPERAFMQSVKQAQSTKHPWLWFNQKPGAKWAFGQVIWSFIEKLENGILTDLFPNLYKMEQNKGALVCERLVEGNNQSKIKLSKSASTVRKGEKEVNSLRSLIELEVAKHDDIIFEWSKCLPITINFFVWRAGMERILTLVTLLRKNIQQCDSMCAMCGIMPEQPITCCYIVTERLKYGVESGSDERLLG